MSKTFAKVAAIAGAVALIATGVGAAAGAGLFTAATAAGAVTAASIAATATTIATYASIAAGVATIAAQATAKAPRARGAVNQLIIASDAPSPYLIGRTYFGGVLRHDVGYGATLKKVPNPYRAMVVVYSVAGPLQGLEAAYMDYAPVTFAGMAATGYYAGFLWRDFRLGLLSETALTPHFGGMPGWSAAHKLSGKAAILWNMLFDKDGKRFASGVPPTGAVWQGVKCYDPRLDSTYPGGSGACRINDEATWPYSECPGLHALTYALGRYRNGKKVFGIGMPTAGLRIGDFVALANVCDANNWKVGGVIFEPGEGVRWQNFREILQAGGAKPVFSGGQLGCRASMPRVALDVITPADLADDDAEITAMQTDRVRLNGIIPKYRSEAHKWEYVQSDLVSVPAYVTEDGEEKNEERQYNLVQHKDQAAQLAAYELVDGRELGPIVLVCKPRLRRYGPGDLLTVALPVDHGLDNVDCIVIARSVDPARMTVTLTLVSDDPAKHDFALGRTGTAPPTPALTAPQDRDDIAVAIARSQVDIEVPSARSYPANYLGILATGAMPDVVTPLVSEGGVSIKTDDGTSYALALSPAGSWASVDNTAASPTKGNIMVTDVPANTSRMFLTVTVDGTAYPAKEIVLTKLLASPPAVGGGGAKIATDSSLNSINSTSYVPLSDDLTVTLASGESLYGTAPVSYIPQTATAQVTRTATLQWQYRLVGTETWIEFGAGITGTFARSPEAGEPEAGVVSANQSVSGLAAGDYQVRLVGRLSQSGRTVVFTGTATLEART